MAGLSKFVEIVFHGDGSQLSAELRKMAGEVELQSKSMGEKLAGVGKAAALGIGAAAVGIAAFSLKAADDFEKSHARIQNATSKTAVGFVGWQSTIKMTDGQLEKFGFTNADTENSLARLVPVTKDQTQAMGLMTLASDIARARHLDLESATQLLVKVQTGHVALLGRLGLNTKDLTGHTIDQKTAITELAQMYGGSAARYTETFGGKIDVLKTKLTDIGVKIGQALIPMIMQLVGWIQKAITWFEHHKTVAEALAIAIGTVLVVAIGAWVASMVAAAAATAVAMLPVLAIIAVVAAVGIAIYEFAKNWDKIWKGIKDVVVTIAQDVLNIALAPIRVAIDAVNTAIDILTGNWSGAWANMQQAVNDALGPILGPIHQIIDAVSSVGSALFGGSSDIAGAINKGKGLAAKQTSAQHGVIKKAGGGDVAPFTRYRVGEQGEEELVMGAQGGTIIPNRALAGGGGDTLVHVVLNVDGQPIHEALLRRQSHVGSLGFRSSN